MVSPTAREKQRVILLTGKMQSGKDTAAAYLHDRYLFTRRKFAAPLYSMLCTMYGDIIHDVNYAYIEARKTERAPLTNLTWREMLQTLGTEWGRTHVNTDIWVDLAREIVAAAYPAQVVISDCRFINEWTAFCNDARFDTRLLAIQRFTLEAQAQTQGGEISVTQHQSEQEIDWLREHADICITNTSIRADLYDQIDGALEDFGW